MNHLRRKTESHRTHVTSINIFHRVIFERKSELFNIEKVNINSRLYYEGAQHVKWIVPCQFKEVERWEESIKLIKIDLQSNIRFF